MSEEYFAQVRQLKQAAGTAGEHLSNREEKGASVTEYLRLHYVT